jgi:hypothetical protein
LCRRYVGEDIRLEVSTPLHSPMSACWLVRCSAHACVLSSSACALSLLVSSSPRAQSMSTLAEFHAPEMRVVGHFLTVSCAQPGAALHCAFAPLAAMAASLCAPCCVFLPSTDPVSSRSVAVRALCSNSIRNSVCACGGMVSVRVAACGDRQVYELHRDSLLPKTRQRHGRVRSRGESVLSSLAASAPFAVSSSWIGVPCPCCVSAPHCATGRMCSSLWVIS